MSANVIPREIRYMLHMRVCFHALSMMTLRLIHWETINFVKISKIFKPINNVPRQRYIRHTRVCFQSIELDDYEKEAPVGSTKIAINFVKIWKLWNHTRINLDDTFCFHVSEHLDDECDPYSVAEARSQSDWAMSEEGMRSWLECLRSRTVFSPVETTLKMVNPMGCKWVSVRKRDKFGNVSWYNARLVAQGLTQCPSINYEEAYSLVVDLITFGYVLSLAVE